MLFDQPPAELPVATVVPRDARSQIAADLRAWVIAKWDWFKPRTIPMVVAFVGMLAVIGSASYLRDYARRTPERLSAHEPAAVGLEVATPAVHSPGSDSDAHRCGVELEQMTQGGGDGAGAGSEQRAMYGSRTK
jgi:hypothetical protein